MSDLFPLPEIDETNGPFWDGLKDGKLLFQKCNYCGHHWLPARQECPSCLASDYEWKSASGKGIMTSWVVYHTAFIPAFKDRLPYNVAIIKLDEGPQLASNIVGEVDQSRFMIDHPVELTIEDEYGVKVPRFKLV
ncbi:OB-fold domain-containing protein [bacterium]|nr:OB-fold domain-containing protein [bacterium]